MRRSPHRRNARHSLRIESLESRHLLSGVPTMVGDVNQTPAANSSSISDSIAFAGKHYFVASTASGVELWSSDGTTAGTKLVRDIHPGSAELTVRHLVAGAGQIYFFANDGAHGVELWRTDGTEGGTLLVKDIFPGPLSGAQFSPTGVVVGDEFFFTANDGVNGYALWKSDGTESGTTMVHDLRAGLADANIDYLANVNGILYFAADDGVHGRELWRSDGTSGGTFMVADVAPGAAGSNLKELTNLNGTLLFSATDGVAGEELWSSAGTAASTLLVADLVPGPARSAPASFRIDGEIGYFVTTASDGTNGLWLTDGTAAGTLQLSDGKLKSVYYVPAELELIGSTLFFMVYAPSQSQSTSFELWKYDPLAGAPQLVRSQLTNNQLSVNPTNVDGVLYFTANAGNGVELWRSDGTEAGTLQVGDLWAGNNSSNPDYLTNVDGTLMFFANDATSTNSLWKVDGTNGATRVAALPPRTAASLPFGMIDVDGVLYYAADDGVHGREVWKVEGDDGVPQLVGDVNPGPDSGLWANNDDVPIFVNVNGTVFFVGNDEAHGSELWKIAPGGAPTLVKDIRPGGSDALPRTGLQLTNAGGVLYFAAFTPEYGTELWRSDGTEAGTFLVKDVYAGTGSGINQAASDPAGSAVEANGALYFVAYGGSFGSQIWRTDGTAAGTVKVTNLLTSSRKPSQLTNVGGQIYFTMTGGASENAIWKTDGTTAGTSRVRMLSSTSLDYPKALTSVGELLYFVATDSWSGRTIWRSDGTMAGTFPVLSPTPTLGGNQVTSATSAFITNVNGVAYFVAYGSPNQQTAIWKSDGTNAGTINVSAGRGAAYPEHLRHAGDRLYFSSTQGGVDEIWSMNIASSEMTLQGSIYRGGNSSITVRGLMRSGESLYFAGNDGAHGAELWRLAIPPRPVGDYNDDARVDGADFLAWQRGFGSATTPAGSGADGDSDETIGAGDLDVWKGSYGAAAIAANEEALASNAPASIAAALMASEEFEDDALDSEVTQTTVRDRIFAAGDFSRLYAAESESGVFRERWRKRR